MVDFWLPAESRSDENHLTPDTSTRTESEGDLSELPGADGSVEGVGAYKEEGGTLELRFGASAIVCVDTNIADGVAIGASDDDPCTVGFFVNN